MHPSPFLTRARRRAVAAAGRPRSAFPSSVSWSLLALAFTLPSLSAQETLNAHTLPQWTATGGAPVVEPAHRGITIPKGAQLSRVFPAGPIEVRLASRPFFSAAPSGWATLEAGPASLTFVRDATGGGLVLLADEPLALPFAVTLDEVGRSREALDFVLTYDPAGGAATLTINQAVFDVEATAPVGQVEVALAAGHSVPWTVEILRVLSGSPSADPAAPGGGGGRSADSPSRLLPARLPSAAAANARKQAASQARALFQQDADAQAEKLLTDANRNPRHSPEWHLETANSLVQTAFSLTRAGQPQKAVALAHRALEHTEKAARQAARQPDQSVLVATAGGLSGFIHEKLLADHAGAKREYSRAALRFPRGGASRQLDRLEQIEAEGRRADAARR